MDDSLLFFSFINLWHLFYGKLSMKLISHLLILGSVLLICSCQSRSPVEEPENLIEVFELPVGDNSKTSLDWAGTYAGVIPCANCAGLEIKLEIENDYSYKLNAVYLGKTSEPVLQSGTFYWNDAGSIITLGGLEEVYQFQVGENQLIKLDQAGNKIEGVLADKYVLVKIKK
jgi:copper homeostasis protein (lipoprotein)